MAKGYNQVEGIENFDTFSPVAKLTTVRAVLALASIRGWHIHQLDVNNVFLHGQLHEDVCLKIPKGAQGVPSNKVCKLLKSLYGLKHASRTWYERLTALLIQHWYKQRTADYTLFVKAEEHHLTIILIYVDDR